MKRVEELAVELEKIYSGSYPYGMHWKIVARHVLIREMKARIEELEQAINYNPNLPKTYNRDDMARLATLTATLKELEGTHDQ